MATITRKGRGGKREALHDARPVGESTVNATDNDGNGQSVEQVSGLSQKPDRAREVCSFSDLVDIITQHNSHLRSNIIVRCWHPNKTVTNVFGTTISDVTVEKGEAAYQLSSGEIIKL
jgi:hypothetical protein